MKIGPRYKIARRLGGHIFDKTSTAKFLRSAERKKPRREGKPRAMTDFGSQMLEKQRIRYSYGILERQFSRYVKDTIKKKGANQAEGLYQKLETRLDNVVYRAGLAPSRSAARQLVSHGHILVNATRVNIPSFTVKPGDIISIRAGSLKSPLFANLSEKLKDRILPVWITFDEKKNQMHIFRLPENRRERTFDFASVIEFYKR